MIKQYKLVGRKVVPCKDMMEAARFYEDHENRVVAKTTVGEIDVSTVFLMFDHRIFGKGPPVLFETMCFSPDETDVGPWMRRYTSYQAAVEGHNKVVEEVRAAMAKAEKAAQEFQYRPILEKPNEDEPE